MPENSVFFNSTTADSCETSRLAVMASTSDDHHSAGQLAAQLNVDLITNKDELLTLAAQPSVHYVLEVANQLITLKQLNRAHIRHEKQLLSSPVSVDFLGAEAEYRRLHGGGKSQLIAKSVGLAKGVKPDIIDCTAGLGRDSFVLASLGCRVLMLERHSVVFTLLANGLQRALAQASEQQHSILARMSLLGMDALTYLQSIGQNTGQSTDQNTDKSTEPGIEQNQKQNTNTLDHQVPRHQAEVIYLDPMFPARSKSALAKKEMRFFHDLVGKDIDATKLLAVAREQAIYRVVVKRPRHAPPLSNITPTFELTGKSSRFDIYVNKKMV